MEGRDSGTKWGNLLGYLISPIPIINYIDPLDYIRKGKVIADRKKNSMEAIFTYKSADLIVKLFGIKVCGSSCLIMSCSGSLFFGISAYEITPDRLPHSCAREC